MQKIFSVFGIVLMYFTIAIGQDINLSVTVTDNNTGSQVLNFGLDPLATDGIDFDLGESNLPPPPPGNAFDGRWWLPPFAGALSSQKDYRNAPAFPFTGTKEHVIKFQSTSYPVTVSWSLPPEIAASSTIRDPFNLQVLSFSGSGSIVISNTAIGQVNLSIDYVNIEPVEPGPLFSVTPASWDFGTVGVGGNSMKTFTVGNTGTANPLTLTSAGISNTDYSVTPNPPSGFPIVINAGGSYNFDVTFTPAGEGVSAGNIEFVHDAPGSPSLVPVTGNGITASQLMFKNDYQLRAENSTYTDTLELFYNGTSPLNSLSFKLRSNPPGSDDILVLTGVEKGSDIASEDWNFFFELKESVDGDYMIVLVYGQDSTTLPIGTYNDFVRFTYDVVNIQGLDTLRSYFRLEEIHSSFINGDPAGVTGDDDQIVDVFGEVFYGDINMDGSVDLLDLILIREYILENITFTPEEFERADLAPWTLGNPEPTPDGIVNVQDLSLLQNIILTGLYPDGTPISGSLPGLFVNNSTIQGDAATVTFYVTRNGIVINTDTEEKIIGMQVELTGLENIPQGMVIDTRFGNGPYYNNNDLLRMLLYDTAGKIELSTGKNYVATIPFEITNPEQITINNIRNVIIVHSNLGKIPGINIEISYDEAPALPTDYELFQNYPNPFNPNTVVKFSVPKTSNVTISIYDMLGREVRTLVAGQVEMGTYNVYWDGLSNSGHQVSSGSYIYRMTAGEFVQAKKMVLIK